MPDPLGALKHKLYRALHEASGLPQLEVQTGLIERDRFKADLALSFRDFSGQVAREPSRKTMWVGS